MSGQMKRAIFIPEILDGIDEELIAASERPGKIIPFAQIRGYITAAVIAVTASIALIGGALMLNNPYIDPPPVTPNKTPSSTATNNQVDSDFIIENGVLMSYIGTKEEIIIPDTVIRINSQAFADAKTVKVISIPETLEVIDQGALTQCPNLETVQTGNNTNITTQNGFVLGNNGSEIHHINKEGYQPVITIPYGVTNIPKNFMNGNSLIEKLILPETVKNIGVNAFYQCENLKEAQLGEVQFIMSGAFFGSALEKVDLGSSLIIIEKQAFLNTKLTTVTIPDTIEIIGNSAFYDTNIDTVVYQGTREQFEAVKHNFHSAFKDFDKISLLFYKEDNSPNSLQFISNGDGTCTVMPSVSKGNSGDIVIEEKSPAGDTVTAIADFNNCKKITSITLPNTVKNLPDSAFEGCILLEKAVVSDEIRIIPQKAFYNCPKLVTFKLPDSLERIENHAFFQNTNFKELIFPKNISYIGDSAFCYNTNVVTVDLSNTSIERIERGAFSGCHKLTELILPKSLKVLDELVFSACITLEKVELPSQIELLGKNCFKNTAIKKITVPGSAVLMDGCFSGCPNLESITLPENLRVIPPSLFSDCPSLEEISIPETVEVIGASAFERTGLKKAVLPEGVTTICDKTFAYCKQLTEVTLQGEITEIGSEAFAGTALTSIFMPDSVKIIRSSAFLSCNKLSDIRFSDSLEVIEERAFYGCDSIRSLTLPEKLTSIGNRGFEFCQALEEIYLPDSLTEMGSYVFANCTSVKKIRLSNSLTVIPSYAFMHNSSLREIELPKAVKMLEHGAFYSAGLVEIIISENTEYVGDRSFYSCPNLKKVTFEGKVELGTNTLVSCPKLEELVFHQAPTFRKSSGVFSGCASLQRVEIKNGYMDLSPTSDAFKNCTSLKYIDFSKISALGYGCFENCRSLDQSITLSPSVTVIPYRAFAYCDSIKSINLGENTVEVGVGAFNECFTLEEISFSCKLTVLGNQAFNGTNIRTVRYKGSAEEWEELEVGLSRFNKQLYNVVFVN